MNISNPSVAKIDMHIFNPSVVKCAILISNSGVGRKIDEDQMSCAHEICVPAAGLPPAKRANAKTPGLSMCPEAL